MEARTYLSELKRLDVRINQKLSELYEIKQLYTKVHSIDLSLGRVQGGASSFTDSLFRAVELEKEINTDIDQFVDMKHSIINMIHELGDSRYFQVLYKVYVSFKPLRVAAMEMQYSYSHIKRLHAEALREFEKRYPMIPT